MEKGKRATISFNGFPAGKMHLIRIPAAFFTDLLPQIDQIGEMKVVLYAFWFLENQEGNASFLRFDDFAADQRLMQGLSENPQAAKEELAHALERACQRGFFLKAQPPGSPPAESIFLLNSGRGRALAEALRRGDWTPEVEKRIPAALELERPNIFRLYEQNIGPLTPMIAETLREAEQTYPMSWIEEAMRSAVENNVRRWRYVEAILQSRQERSAHATNQRNPEEDRFRYLKGEFGEFGEY